MMDAASINPYGRSFEEYCFMFSLGDPQRRLRILGVGDGASTFNAEGTRRGWHIVSVDPIYRFSGAQIDARCGAVLENMLQAVALSKHHWIWRHFEDVDALRRHRQRTEQEFAADFRSTSAPARYVAAALPDLPFSDRQFDLAVCSHVLFSWSSVFDLEFHRRAMREMLRVASEVRVCPTGRNLAARRSPFVEALARELTGDGFTARIDSLDGGMHAAFAEQLVVTGPM